MKKGKQVFYLDREHNLVDASRADTFSPKEAHRIIPEIEKSLKDYEISFLATSKKIRRQAQKVAGKNPRVETPKEEEKFPKKIRIRNFYWNPSEYGILSGYSKTRLFLRCSGPLYRTRNTAKAQS